MRLPIMLTPTDVFPTPFAAENKQTKVSFSPMSVMKSSHF